jgi:hypothetical protein
MKNNRLLLFAGSLLMPMVVMAGPRSFQQAKAIAEKQAALLGVTIDQKAMTKARKQGDKGEMNLSQESYYVFPNANSKGFTIVSGDDRLPEIVGYSSQGSYDENNLPEGFISFMEAYQNLYNKVNLGDAEALKNLAEIKAWRNKKNASAASTSAVAPLLGNIEWDQTSPYNNMCPKYDSVHVAATGCVATAMAQVMAYYKYPKQLKADIPGYVNRWNGIPMEIPTITQEEGIYDWDNMLPKYNKEANATQQQKDAVAKLMYHCGAAVRMSYGPESGAAVSSSKLAKYFGYDADLMMDLSRSSFTLDKWMQIIDTELAAGRPVLYGGQSSENGHQFICDGKDENGLYHINWGWSGNQNAYFDLSILNPEKGGTGSGSAADGFNRYCTMTIGIAPDNGVVDAPLAQIPSISVLYDADYVVITKGTRKSKSDKFEFTQQVTFVNQVKQAFKGFLGLGILQKDGSYKLVSDKKYVSFDGKREDGMMSSLDPKLTVNEAFEVGKTPVYAIYSTDGKTWEKADYMNGNAPLVVKATDYELSLASALNAQLKLESAELKTGAKSTFQVTLSNDCDFEYQGIVNVFSDMIAEKPSALVTDIFVSVPAHGTITRSFELLPKKAGDLYLWLDDAMACVNVGGTKAGMNLIDAQKFTVEQGEVPTIYLVEASTNAEPELYETELAYFGGKLVRAPRVNDDKAVFTYKIQNDGPAATVTMGFAAVSGDDPNPVFTYYTEDVALAGNGEVTTFTKTVTPEEIGSHSICGSMMAISSSQLVDFPTYLSPYILYYVEPIDNYQGFSMKPAMQLVYVSGTSAGISHIEKDASGFWDVYTLSGQKVKSVAAGSDLQRLGLPSGIYVVNHHKILVK